ncbi:MAG TPA: hypothetical protein VKT51_09735 [Candidatus Eremiobacteraceae bacterium]|nr:hypothetical protein [Candidatus Eremiobacteraceae bacterium]
MSGLSIGRFDPVRAFAVFLVAIACVMRARRPIVVGDTDTDTDADRCRFIGGRASIAERYRIIEQHRLPKPGFLSGCRGCNR